MCLQSGKASVAEALGLEVGRGWPRPRRWMDGKERVVSILKPVGTTEGLEQSGRGSLKTIQQLLWAEQMGGYCCFGLAGVVETR